MPIELGPVSEQKTESFEFDLNINGEQRSTFARNLRTLGQSAQDMSVSIETGDDAHVIKDFMTFALMLSSVIPSRDMLEKAMEEHERKVKSHLGRV